MSNRNVAYALIVMFLFIVGDVCGLATPRKPVIQTKFVVTLIQYRTPAALARLNGTGGPVDSDGYAAKGCRIMRSVQEADGARIDTECGDSR